MIMKPIKDIFTSHIEGLYKGYEVDAPESIQEGVFNQLDAMNESTVSVTSSVGFTSKAVISAAVVIVGFAWYLMPVSEDQVVVDEVEFLLEVLSVIDRRRHEHVLLPNLQHRVRELPLRLLLHGGAEVDFLKERFLPTPREADDQHLL